MAEHYCPNCGTRMVWADDVGDPEVGPRPYLSCPNDACPGDRGEWPPAFCEMCGDRLSSEDELGEFGTPAGFSVVGHSQCGLDRGLQVA